MRHTVIKRLIQVTLSLATGVVLSQCGDNYVVEKNAPVSRLAKRLDTASHHDALYAQAYQSILSARKKEKQAPDEAILLYLTAARTAYQSRDTRWLPLYNHAVGQVVDLLVGRPDAHAYVELTDASTGFVLKNFDDVLPADCLKIGKWRTRVKQPGIGAPLVVRRYKASITGVDKNMATPIGQTYAVTAVMEFPDKGKPRLRLVDPTETSQVRFWGEPRLLANDLTVPLAVSMDEGITIWKQVVLKWFGVLVPERFVSEMRLYMNSPFDPHKIPVVFVHGLKSDPITWRNAMNEINADPELRKSYQFIAFYYPTGLPLRVPSAALKRGINKLYGYYAQAGMKKNAEQMVIIGHSLGGLLTSVQVRQIEPNLMKRIFKRPVDQSEVNQGALEDYRYLIEGPKPHFVKRVIFVCTPHRGSKYSDIYPVRILSSLVEIPKNLLFLKLPETTAALTDFGRSLFGEGNKENSLSLLRSRSATLSLLENSPIYKHIQYHSIIGDRGRGDTPDSTDGVVAYKSSHLDGARSEKIVPYGHDANEQPKAIEEMARILRLHLRNQ